MDDIAALPGQRFAVAINRDVQVSRLNRVVDDKTCRRLDGAQEPVPRRREPSRRARWIVPTVDLRLPIASRECSDDDLATVGRSPRQTPLGAGVLSVYIEPWPDADTREGLKHVRVARIRRVLKHCAVDRPPLVERVGVAI